MRRIRVDFQRNQFFYVFFHGRNDGSRSGGVQHDATEALSVAPVIGEMCPQMTILVEYTAAFGGQIQVRQNGEKGVSVFDSGIKRERRRPYLSCLALN